MNGLEQLGQRHGKEHTKIKVNNGRKQEQEQRNHKQRKHNQTREERHGEDGMQGDGNGGSVEC